MWYDGLLGLTWWQIALVTLALTHGTIVCVTVYLHRFSAHRAMELHPALEHAFRFWLWMTTGMNTKEWTAIHRKHHAFVESQDDPHSPVIEGLSKVLWEGTELYRVAGTAETLEKYGKGTPEDWLEKNVYTPRSTLGIYSMLAINLHTYPSSAKLSVKWFEFDLGWAWIKLFTWLGLARVKRLPPVVHRRPEKHEIDFDTIMAVINNRFHVMSQFASTVVVPLAEKERIVADRFKDQLLRRARSLLCRDEKLLDAETRERRTKLLAESQVLAVSYQFRLELQQLWENRTASKDELLSSLKEWCHKAEASGIAALEEFSLRLRSYTTAPLPA